MPPSAPSNDPSLLGPLLRLLSQQWGNDVHGALDAAGFGDIRAPHANVMPFVPPEGIQIGELAARARVRKQTMAQSVRELETLGYVERRPDPADRRATLVVPTERGRAVKPQALAAGRAVEREWAARSSERAVEDLRRSLRRLLDALADQPANA